MDFAAKVRAFFFLLLNSFEPKMAGSLHMRENAGRGWGGVGAPVYPLQGEQQIKAKAVTIPPKNEFYNRRL